MNKIQKQIVLIASLLLIAMCIYVPFKAPLGMSPSYDFIWNGNVKIGTMSLGNLPLDYERLALQAAIVLAAAFAGIFIFRRRGK